MKIFNTSEDILEMANTAFEETSGGLAQIGINLKVISAPKGKSILKVQRTNPTTQFLTKKDIILTIYEAAFDRLTDEHKRILLDGAFSNVAYDSEKDRILVETDFAKEIFRMRKKYPNYVDIAEQSYLIIQQLEDEEKQRKEDEKIRKADEKAAKKRAQKY